MLVLEATDHVSEPVQGCIQNIGVFGQQHLPQHFGVAAVSKQITPQERSQLIGCDVLQLWDSERSFTCSLRQI